MELLREFLNDLDGTCTCLNKKTLNFKVQQILNSLRERNLTNYFEMSNEFFKNKSLFNDEKRFIDDPLDINTPIGHYNFNPNDEHKLKDDDQKVEKFNIFDLFKPYDINKIDDYLLITIIIIILKNLMIIILLKHGLQMKLKAFRSNLL